MKCRLSVNISNMKTATVRVQGKKATSGSVFVPKEWENRQVLVLLLESELGEADYAESADYQEKN